jgi:DNA-binding transcriptional LysR family regulator
VDKAVRSIDANLLLPLHALLGERNLTHAGHQLVVSQPAMSGALARLRRHFDDPLLVRHGRGYELTPLAERIRPAVAAAVEALEGVFGEGPRFVPDTAHRTFAITLTEYAMTVLARPLVQLLSERAPNIDVDFAQLPTDSEGLAQDLVRRDLIVGPAGFGIPGRAQPLFSDRFVCVVAAGNPRLRDGALNLDDLAEMPHAVARFGMGDLVLTPDSQALSAAGIERDVRVVVPGLLTLPPVVCGTDLCAFVPLRLADRCRAAMGLAIARTPLPPITMVEQAHWHPARMGDPALSWLRATLHQVALALEVSAGADDRGRDHAHDRDRAHDRDHARGRAGTPG